VKRIVLRKVDSDKLEVTRRLLAGRKQKGNKKFETARDTSGPAQREGAHAGIPSQSRLTAWNRKNRGLHKSLTAGTNFASLLNLGPNIENASLPPFFKFTRSRLSEALSLS
jgi:hypothetical protein